MLQVAVDHRDEFGARRQPALDHRAREAEAIDAPDAAQRADRAPPGRRRRRRCRRANRRRRRSFPTAGRRAPSSGARTGRAHWPLRGRSARPRRGSAALRASPDQNSFRARRGARGDSRAATSMRIRHGKGARQAMRGNERERDFVAPGAAATRAIAADRSRRNRGAIRASVFPGAASGTTMTPSCPTKRALSSRNAMPRGSSEKTKDGRSAGRAPARSCRPPTIWSRRRRRRRPQRRRRAQRAPVEHLQRRIDRARAQRHEARRPSPSRPAKRRGSRSRRAAPPRRSPIA